MAAKTVGTKSDKRKPTMPSTPLARSGRRGCATFVYVVEVGFLAHGREQVQDAGVDADLVIAVVIPGIVLDHVEQLTDKKQDPMFGMILVENQKRT